MKRSQWVAIAVAVLGIAVELYAIFMLSSRRMESRTAMTLIVVGMFVAFVPIFMLSRRRGRR